MRTGLAELRTNPMSSVGFPYEDNTRRPIGLCSLQFGEIPLDKLLAEMSTIGFDRIELGCSPNHFDPDRALSEPEYVAGVIRMLTDAEISCISIACHSVGLPLCAMDPLDPGYEPFVGSDVWGDGSFEDMWARSAERLMTNAKAAKALGVEYVKLFFGSPFYGRQQIDFPPRDKGWMEDRWAVAVDRIRAVLDFYDEQGVYAALEPHPGELAYNYETMMELLARVDHPRLTFNLDPSHLAHQGMDPAAVVRALPEGVIHVCHIKGSRKWLGGLRSLRSPLPMGDQDRGWNFVYVPAADFDLADFVAAMNDNGLPPGSELSLEHEDNRMGLLSGAAAAYQHMYNTLDFLKPTKSFEEGMKGGAEQ